MNTEYKSTETLFRQALAVMNQALEHNQEKLFYKQVIELTQQFLGETQIGVAIYQDDAETPHDYFTITFADKQFVVVAHGKEEPDLTWKVPESYLAKVCENSQHYIDHPELLDWDWLKSRLGL